MKFHVHAFISNKTNEVVALRDTPGKPAWQHLADVRAASFRRGAIWTRLPYVPVQYSSEGKPFVPGLGFPGKEQHESSLHRSTTSGVTDQRVQQAV